VLDRVCLWIDTKLENFFKSMTLVTVWFVRGFKTFGCFRYPNLSP